MGVTINFGSRVLVRTTEPLKKVTVDGDVVRVSVRPRKVNVYASTGGITINQGNGGRPGPDGTLVVTSDVLLTKDHDRYRLYNTGATDAVVATLPDSATLDVGWSVKLRVTALEAFRLATQGGDVLVRAAETASAPYLESAEFGAVLDVEYAGAGNFVVSNYVGPWDAP